MGESEIDIRGDPGGKVKFRRDTGPERGPTLRAGYAGFFQAQDGLFETLVPVQSSIGILGIDPSVETGKVTLSAGCDVNEVCHAGFQILRRSL